MEKLKINQICILCTKSIADGRMGKFFTDRGVDPRVSSLEGTHIGSYYFSDGIVLRRCHFKPKNRIQINPWKKIYRKFPREMMVSDDKRYWRQLKVFGKVQSQWLTEPGYQKYISWNYAKEIDTPKKLSISDRFRYLQILQEKRQTKEIQELIQNIINSLENEFIGKAEELKENPDFDWSKYEKIDDSTAS